MLDNKRISKFIQNKRKEKYDDKILNKSYR